MASTLIIGSRQTFLVFRVFIRYAGGNLSIQDNYKTVNMITEREIKHKIDKLDQCKL